VECTRTKAKIFFEFPLAIAPIIHYNSPEQKLNKDDFGDFRRVQHASKSPFGIWRNRPTFASIPPPAAKYTRRHLKGAPRG
jgi:hypothetical protein